MCIRPMLLLAAYWQGLPTFKLTPLHEHTPYQEIIYDPLGQVLIIAPRLKNVFMPVQYVREPDRITKLLETIAFNWGQFDLTPYLH